MSQTPLRVAVTGAAGQIGYSLLFRIASGAMFGPDQPVILHLLEIEPALPALGGVVMELDDCAFPLLKGIVPTANLDEGFRGVNWALLVGSVPRKAGMERKDLLGINGKIFIGQGRAIQKNAARDVRIHVVGNPCNTNCLICMNNAPDVPRDRFFAMTRLDENRAKAQLAKKAGVDVTAVSNMTIWGNHSATQYPDFYNAKINGKPAIRRHHRRSLAQRRIHFDRSATRRGHHQGARLRPAPPVPPTRSWTASVPSSNRRPPATGTACAFVPTAVTALKRVLSVHSPSAATAKNSKSFKAFQSMNSAARKLTRP